MTWAEELPFRFLPLHHTTEVGTDRGQRHVLTGAGLHDHRRLATKLEEVRGTGLDGGTRHLHPLALTGTGHRGQEAQQRPSAGGGQQRSPGRRQ